MIDQFSAILPPTAITPDDTYLVPALVAHAGDQAAGVTSSSSPATSATCAYWCASEAFSHGERRGQTLPAIRSFDVAAWVEELGVKYGAPGVKQLLAAVRMLFDWLVTGK